MRKSPLFTAVLTLFLLVPASITWAQTVSITGNVYENNLVKIPFKTPQGKITVWLPDDMAAGDVISGTIQLEPEGTTTRQKEKNLADLEKYTLKLDDFIVPVDQKKFEWIVHLDRKISVPLEVQHVGAVKPHQARVPIQPVRTPAPTPKYLEPFYLDKPIVRKGDPIILFSRNGNFLPGTQFFLATDANNSIPLLPISTSPREAILNGPSNFTGPGTLKVYNDKNQNIYSAPLNVIEIEASIGQTRLRRGESTQLSVSVTGMKDYDEPVFLTIVNVTNSIITLTRGNHQTYTYHRTGDAAGTMQLQQAVVGITPGDYNITANLVLPAAAFGDVFHQQKSALKSPEDFNAWVKAVKKDLKAYADKQGTDNVGQAAKANAQYAIDNIPTCSDKNKLDECKTFADIALRRVEIPKAAATMWVCGFEAYKAAIKAITGTLAGKPELIDWEVIKNGLEFIRNMGEQLKDENLKNGATDAKKIIDGIQKAGETKEKLENLKQKLDELNQKLGKNISDESPMYLAYEMEDLMVSSYSSSLQHAWPVIQPPYTILQKGRLFGGITGIMQSSPQFYSAYMGPHFGSSMSDWINSALYNRSSSIDLDIIIPSTGKRVNTIYEFKNVFITEINFPELDATKKDHDYLSLQFKTSDAKFSTTDEKIKSWEPKAEKNKRWAASNFTIEISGLNSKPIMKIDDIKFTTKITPDNLDFKRMPNFGIYLNPADIKSFKDWLDKFEAGKGTLDLYKSGRIEYLDENNNPLYSLEFPKIKPVSITPVENGLFRFVVQPEEMKFSYNPLPGFLFDIHASTYIANEIAGDPCNPEGAKTISWLYIEKPCRVELVTTRASNINPDAENVLSEIEDLLSEISEDGAELGGKLAKTFSITKSFAVWIRVVRDWESYKAEYVCRNGKWQHGQMTLADSGEKVISNWELFRGESGNDTWHGGDDMGWIMKQAEELKKKVCK